MIRLLILFFLVLSNVNLRAEIVNPTPTGDIAKLHQVGAAIGQQGCKKPINVRNTLVKSESDGSIIGTVTRTTCSGMILQQFESNESARKQLTSLRILKSHKSLPRYARIGNSRSEIEAELGPPAGNTLPTEVRKSIGVKKLSAIYYDVPEEGPDDHIIVFFFKGDRLAQIYWSFVN